MCVMSCSFEILDPKSFPDGCKLIIGSVYSFSVMDCLFFNWWFMVYLLACDHQTHLVNIKSIVFIIVTSPKTYILISWDMQVKHTTKINVK